MAEILGQVVVTGRFPGPNPVSSMQDPGSKIQDTRIHRTPDTGYRIHRIEYIGLKIRLSARWPL